MNSSDFVKTENVPETDNLNLRDSLTPHARARRPCFTCAEEKSFGVENALTTPHARTRSSCFTCAEEKSFGVENALTTPHARTRSSCFTCAEEKSSGVENVLHLLAVLEMTEKSGMRRREELWGPKAKLQEILDMEYTLSFFYKNAYFLGLRLMVPDT